LGQLAFGSLITLGVVFFLVAMSAIASPNVEAARASRMLRLPQMLYLNVLYTFGYMPTFFMNNHPESADPRFLFGSIVMAAIAVVGWMLFVSPPVLDRLFIGFASSGIVASFLTLLGNSWVRDRLNPFSERVSAIAPPAAPASEPAELIYLMPENSHRAALPRQLEAAPQAVSAVTFFKPEPHGSKQDRVVSQSLSVDTSSSSLQRRL
jgi:hypothetical protein